MDIREKMNLSVRRNFLNSIFDRFISLKAHLEDQVFTFIIIVNLSIVSSVIYSHQLENFIDRNLCHSSFIYFSRIIPDWFKILITSLGVWQRLSEALPYWTNEKSVGALSESALLEFLKEQTTLYFKVKLIWLTRLDNFEPKII